MSILEGALKEKDGKDDGAGAIRLRRCLARSLPSTPAVKHMGDLNISNAKV